MLQQLMEHPGHPLKNASINRELTPDEMKIDTI